jgi:hypothetical protein
VFFTTKALSYNIWAIKVSRQAFRSRWSLVVGRWSLVVGRWSLVVGRWSLVVGRWSLVVGRRILPSVPAAQLINISRKLTPCDQIFPLNKTIAGPSSLQLSNLKTPF